MTFLPASKLARAAADQGYAVPSFCAWDSVTMHTILRVASECRAPVMLMCGRPEFQLMPPAAMAATARAVAASYDVPAALHLDHGGSLAEVDQCLAAGFSSVMLDYSNRPFDQNVAAVREVVERARPRKVSVEGELGIVGRADEVTSEGVTGHALTDPAEASDYVARTGVDMLAVAIGNAHGLYRHVPRFDFARLAELRAAAGVPLVLHGGSGTPEEDLRKAISLGIAKVNVASELVHAVRQTLFQRWQSRDSLWVPIAMRHAMDAYAEVAERWLCLTGAAGKADGFRAAH
jgi:ketose-bisphosphate aldolase